MLKLKNKKNCLKSLQTTGLIVVFAVFVAIAVGLNTVSLGQTENKPAENKSISLSAEDAKLKQKLTESAIDYLRLVQNENGGFSTQMGMGTTTVVLAGLLETDLPINDPIIKSALDYLLQSVRADGGIYSPGGRIGNYETCLAIQCLILAQKKLGTDKYAKELKAAEKYIRGQQYSEENGTSEDDLYYGGSGYGKNQRPDLSNTQFFMETLNELGVDEDDEAMQRAMVFVSRCQNFESEHNTTELASKNPDGGFFYTCVVEGENPKAEGNTGGLRSYGSMTYAGLKSMIYAGLDESDSRFAAAKNWIAENYTLDENPGIGEAGLYYYYQVLSRTLEVLKNDTFTSKDNVQHIWKSELLKKLENTQAKDGSWVNNSPRWMENDPVLVTGYVLMVLGNM